MTPGSLNLQLEAMERGLKQRVPAQVYRVLKESIDELRRNGLAEGRRVGDRAPAFRLQGAAGGWIDLDHELTRGPIVLTFYRGGWCPYCNLQLRAYQEVLPQIRERGVSLIAISPQSPDHVLTQTERENLAFLVGSDTDGEVARQYRVLYEVPDKLHRVLESFGADLQEYNGTERPILPVPATYVIDCNGIIRYAHADPDFMRRLEPEVLLEALRALSD